MGTETFPKGGKTTHKAFGTERGASFVPADTRTEYRQTGSDTNYPKSGKHIDGSAASGYKFNSRGSTPFAKGGGNKLVSAHYPDKRHQDTFGTDAPSKQDRLGPARTKTGKVA